MSLRGVLALSLALALPGAASGRTVLVLDSEGGDSIGQGLLRTFDTDDGNFTVTENFDAGVSVVFDGVEFWTLEFAAAGGVPLAPGLYDGATRYPFQSPLDPGLTIYGDGRSCGDSTGRFYVHEVVYGMGGAIDSFAADFVQRCDNSNGRLIGAIRVNSSDSLPDLVDADEDGMSDVADNCAGVANASQNDGDFDGIGDACDDGQQASFILFDSEEGDFIGQGVRQLWTAGNGNVSARIQAGTLVFGAEGAEGYTLNFAQAGGGPPGVGVYEGATGLINGPTEPRLAISGDGRACDSIGRFEVFEAEYDLEEVIRFSADFEQRCDSGEAALKGVVRWHAAFRPAPKDLDGDGYLTKEDNCPGVPNPAQFDTDGNGSGDGCLSPAMQKCVNDMNKGAAATARLAATANLACLKNAAKGKTDKLGSPATAQDCLSNDVGGKLASAATKLAARGAASCAGGSDFGYTDAATVSEAAVTAGRAGMADLFGGDLDAALILAAADAVGAKCQDEVTKRANAANAALWKLVLKQKKALLAGKKILAATDSESLAEMLDAFLATDPKGAVTRPFAAIDAGVASRCGGVALATAFPGCAPADAAALGACAERSVRCRFCQTLAAADGLPIDCDLFDDATADLSCQ